MANTPSPLSMLTGYWVQHWFWRNTYIRPLAYPLPHLLLLLQILKLVSWYLCGGQGTNRSQCFPNMWLPGTEIIRVSSKSLYQLSWLSRLSSFVSGQKVPQLQARMYPDWLDSQHQCDATIHSMALGSRPLRELLGWEKGQTHQRC